MERTSKPSNEVIDTRILSCTGLQPHRQGKGANILCFGDDCRVGTYDEEVNVSKECAMDAKSSCTQIGLLAQAVTVTSVPAVIGDERGNCETVKPNIDVEKLATPSFEIVLIDAGVS